jgi:hypothetical protein
MTNDLTKIVLDTVSTIPEILLYLSNDARLFVKLHSALKAVGDYTSIRAEMSGGIHDAVYDYLTGSGNVTTYRAAMALAISQAYVAAADIGYQDAGAELPLDAETAAWARAELDSQLAYVDDLFETLKELRKQDDVNAAAEALRRANGYASSLDALYAGAKMRGSENITLEFGGTDGKESCSDCKRLVGKRHKISYILAHNLIPAPGNDTFECKGYECNHYWFNPKTGERFTA